MELAELLKTAPQFAALSAEDIDLLEKALVVRNYPDGHQFFREGAVGDAIYIVIEGQVEMTHLRMSQRDWVHMAKEGPGSVFGFLALIGDNRRLADCKAVGPVKAASLSREAFNLLFEADSPFPSRFKQVVAQQLAADCRAVIRLFRQELLTELAAQGEPSPAHPERRKTPDRRSGTDRRTGKGSDA